MTQRITVRELMMHILSGLNTELIPVILRDTYLNKTACVRGDVAGSKMGIGLTDGCRKIMNTVSPVQLMGKHTQWCFYVPWRRWTEHCHSLGSTSFADKSSSPFIPQFIHWWNTQMFIGWKKTENLRGRSNFKNPLLVIIIISTFPGISFWWRKCLQFLLPSDATLTIFFSLKVIEYKD